MLVSRAWLEQFIPELTKVSSEDIARELMMKTVEVEDIIEQAGSLKNIVVGKVTSIEKHPDADALNVCMVDVGDEILEVVCGGSNVAPGMKVAMGKIGSMVRWHGEGDLISLKKAKIRGAYSSGMICASDEIGLADLFPKSDEKEIIDLSALKARVGMPLADALSLNDTIFDIENKSLSNRPDLFGHYGIAREVATIFDLRLLPYETTEISGRGEAPAVTVESTDLCPRYSAVRVHGVTVGESSGEMKVRLSAVGQRPINSIVDITNYIAFELGQPMHAFDADKLVGGIVVRNAMKGEKIKTRGGKEHKLSSDMLVIADDSGPIAIAGVIGGDGSQVTDETTNIIFESANFDAVSVRRTSTKLGIRTDSSTRFEKAQDPENTMIALERAVAMVDGSASKVTDIDHSSKDSAQIDLSVDYVRQKIGIQIQEEDMRRILSGLGFGVKGGADTLTVTVPSWRSTKDVSIREDLVEEILRMYGYDQVEGVLPTFSIEPPRVDCQMRLEREWKDLLAKEFGFIEVYNYSFESPEWLARLGEDGAGHLRLLNPVAKDRPLIRRSLLPNMLEGVRSNLDRYDRVALFETGLIYRGDAPGERLQPGDDRRLPEQKRLFSISFAERSESVPYRVVAAAVSRLFAYAGVTVHYERTTPMSITHPGRSAAVKVGESTVGHIGELHPRIAESIGIDCPVAMVELDLESVVEVSPGTVESHYLPLPEYPSTSRDVSAIVDEEISFESIMETISDIHPLITDVLPLSVYRGKGIDEGKKSVAVRITYRSDEMTLEAKEVDDVHGEILKMFEKKFGADIRK